MAWFILFLGGIAEVGFTTCLRYVSGFKNVPWTLGFIVCIAVSMICLDTSTKAIPLGTAYPVWTGIGTLGTVLIGMVYFGEPATAIRIALILGLIACVAGLKMTTGH